VRSTSVSTRRRGMRGRSGEETISRRAARGARYGSGVTNGGHGARLTARDARVEILIVVVDGGVDIVVG
jgi:hypothetical protein